ncbi:MAG: hypothetical protein IPL67_10455 [Ignavibacteria bacterium]|nr:hypothetical protein [Ignavibacteria bacterium]
MKKQTITLTGFIRNALSKVGLPNLKVEVRDRDIRIDDIAGIGVTNKNGRFNIIMKPKE